MQVFFSCSLCPFSSAEVAIVRSNVEVLVKEGLGPRGETDFLLTRDVCMALNKLVGGKRVYSSFRPGHNYTTISI